jgi:hypothetical protein
MGQKASHCLFGVDGERGCGGEEFDGRDAGEDEGGSAEGASAQTLMQDEERGEAGEDRFEGDENRSVGGGEMLLGPALNGECGGGGEQAGDGERDEEARCRGQVWAAA